MREEAAERPEALAARVLGQYAARHDTRATLATVSHRAAAHYVRLRATHRLNDGCLAAWAFFTGFYDTVDAEHGQRHA